MFALHTMVSAATQALYILRTRARETWKMIARVSPGKREPGPNRDSSRAESLTQPPGASETKRPLWRRLESLCYTREGERERERWNLSNSSDCGSPEERATCKEQKMPAAGRRAERRRDAVSIFFSCFFSLAPPVFSDAQFLWDFGY